METLNRKQFYSNIITIALPIAAQSLIASSLNLIDNLMVGSLGETELAAGTMSVHGGDPFVKMKKCDRFLP